MYEIKTSYTNKKGETYNIRDIHFEKFSDLAKGHGGFICESNASDSSSIFVKPYKVYIFKSLHDSKKVFRIYDDYADYKFSSHEDDKLISKLQEKQKNIKLTKFPTGVITIENKIIGQEIPFYHNAMTLTKLFKENLYDVFPTEIYLKVLKILKELYKNGILYCDIHSNNFLIQNGKIKLIDFEEKYIAIDEWYKDTEKNALTNLKEMLKVLNMLSGTIMLDLDKTTNLDEIEECVIAKDIKLKK